MESTQQRAKTPRQKEHAAYLRSPEWQAKRGHVFRRDGYLCQACLQAPAQQVHHLTYLHWGNEPLFDLVSVCRPCHEGITELDRAGGRIPKEHQNAQTMNTN